MDRVISILLKGGYVYNVVLIPIRIAVINSLG